QITAFVMDNATNNDTMVTAFARRCRAERIPFSATNARMRCMPHTIHLYALKLLEAIGALTKEEKRKAKSRANAYQDAATEPVDRAQDNMASQLDDGDDAESIKPTSIIGSAVFKVSFFAPEFYVSLITIKLRKIVRHVRSSPQRRKIWQKEVGDVAAAAPGTIDSVLMLILDVKTRWSSTHQMLRRFHSYVEFNCLPVLIMTQAAPFCTTCQSSTM
ncbi:hypothetical protein B0H16DRAFT_1347658, partial [Mycena metata]